MRISMVSHAVRPKRPHLVLVGGLALVGTKHDGIRRLIPKQLRLEFFRVRYQLDIRASAIIVIVEANLVSVKLITGAKHSNNAAGPKSSCVQSSA